MPKNRSALHNKPRVVIDTNVWLSGLVFGGKPAEIIDLFEKGGFHLIVSEELLSELRRILNRRFRAFAPRLPQLEASIRSGACEVKLGSAPVAASRDHNDDMFIETAMLGGADFIVSGDNDLLAIGQYQGIQILTPAEFLEQLQS